MPTAKHRLVFVYVLNILAAFAVVMLHVSLDVFSPQAGGDPTWFTSFGLQAAFIFAVPVFFAVSGMNLLDYRSKYDTRTFFVRRVRRVGVVLLFGSALCYLLYGLFPGQFGMARDPGVSLGGFVDGFLNNSINDTYWFFYTLIYLYILTPLLSLAASHRHLLVYLMACCFVSSMVLPMLAAAGCETDSLSLLFKWGAFSNEALLYYIGGYYISTYIRCCHGPKAVLTACALGYVVSTLLMALCSSMQNGITGLGAVPGSYDRAWISTYSPLCAAQAFFVFMGAKSLEPRLSRWSGRAKALVAQVSGATLGVYVIQMPIINWLGWRLGFPRYMWLQNAVVRGVVVFFVALVLSLAWSWAWHNVRDRVLGGARQQGR